MYRTAVVQRPVQTNVVIVQQQPGLILPPGGAAAPVLAPPPPFLVKQVDDKEWGDDIITKGTALTDYFFNNIRTFVVPMLTLLACVALGTDEYL